MCRMLWTSKIWKSGQAVGMLEHAVGFLEKLTRNVQALRLDSDSVRLKVQTFVIGWFVIVMAGYRNLSSAILIRNQVFHINILSFQVPVC